ncbi:CFEM domain-containing protein [Rutstroemia sp. NJR-2017a WRK4]|nr:CFEM domain-containing protein [Rutstroemia sp. NJR-2017a WRK4]
MKYPLVTLLVSGTLVTAIDFPDLPSCASSCLSSAITAGAHCNIEDSVCQCSSASQAAIQTTAIPCLLTACPQSDLQIAVSAGQGLCARVTATATSSSHSSSSSTTAAPVSAASSTSVKSTSSGSNSTATSSKASTTAAGTTAAGTGGGGGKTTAGTGSASGGGGGGSRGGNSTVTTGTPKTSGTGAAGSGSGSGTATGTGGPSQVSGNAAQSIEAGVGGLVVVLAGMVIGF